MMDTTKNSDEKLNRLTEGKQQITTDKTKDRRQKATEKDRNQKQSKYNE